MFVPEAIPPVPVPAVRLNALRRRQDDLPSLQVDVGHLVPSGGLGAVHGLIGLLHHLEMPLIVGDFTPYVMAFNFGFIVGY